MTASLDTHKHGLYKPPPLERRAFRKAPALVLAVLLGGIGLPVSAEVVNGVQLPDGAEKVGENRYRSRGDFELTVKYFKTVLPPGQYPRKSIVKQPGVQALHIENPSRKKWEGINIYEARDEVRIFIIVAPEPPKPAPKPPKGSGGPAPAKK